MQTRVYQVGRLSSAERPDIAIPPTEKSVSRRHLELTVSSRGEYYLVHVHPRNTTEVRTNGAWVEIDQTGVEADTPLRLGTYETTVRALLGMLRAGATEASAAPERAEPREGGVGSGGIEWDPETGCMRSK